jgi:hypothetical protein
LASGSAGRLTDPRGNPSRWVALLFALVFAAAAIAMAVIAALRGDGYYIVVVLGLLFMACFDVAFGRRPAVVQVASVFARGLGSRSHSGD